jgi:GNAT superfamily N-acetyltransferase
MLDIGQSDKLMTRISRAAWRILRRAGIRFAAAYVYMLDIGDYIPNQKRIQEVPNISIGLCTARETERSSTLGIDEKNSAKDLLVKGHLMISAFSQGEIASYVWLSFQEVYVEELDRYVNFDGAYFWGAHTIPPFRSKGIMKQVMMHALRIACEKADRAYAVIDVGNMPSRRVAEGFGARPVKLLRFLKVFIWSRHTDRDFVVQERTRGSSRRVD